MGTKATSQNDLQGGFQSKGSYRHHCEIKERGDKGPGTWVSLVKRRAERD